MYIASLTKETFLDASKKIDTVIIPIGSLEAHGSHCPLGTDIIVPERILSMVEKLFGQRIFIAPTVNYGYTPSLTHFPGTIHISGDTLFRYVSEIGEGWTKWGIKNIVLFNGHGGNIPSLSLAGNRIAVNGVKVMLINWWTTYAQEILTICDAQGHAGEDETSVVLAIDPNLVHMDKAGLHDRQPMTTLFAEDMIQYSYPDALSGDATKATAEKGHAIYEKVVQSFCIMLERLWVNDLTDLKKI